MSNPLAKSFMFHPFPSEPSAKKKGTPTLSVGTRMTSVVFKPLINSYRPILRILLHVISFQFLQKPSSMKA